MGYNLVTKYQQDTLVPTSTDDRQISAMNSIKRLRGSGLKGSGAWMAYGLSDKTSNHDFIEFTVPGSINSQCWGLGMVIPPLIGILIMGISTPTIGLMTIPYYMEIMGV